MVCEGYFTAWGGADAATDDRDRAREGQGGGPGGRGAPRRPCPTASGEKAEPRRAAARARRPAGERRVPPTGRRGGDAVMDALLATALVVAYWGLLWLGATWAG